MRSPHFRTPAATPRRACRDGRRALPLSRPSAHPRREPVPRRPACDRWPSPRAGRHVRRAASPHPARLSATGHTPAARASPPNALHQLEYQACRPNGVVARRARSFHGSLSSASRVGSVTHSTVVPSVCVPFRRSTGLSSTPECATLKTETHIARSAPCAHPGPTRGIQLRVPVASLYGGDARRDRGCGHNSLGRRLDCPGRIDASRNS